ncbi:NAD(P)/FAD-dependent oxidoreductase [Streptomyces sp. NPDC020983]|uniref:NAD(P)/FAD-dependent oxidoreductase n=1 Tax=Streptomyces sp. NPDC020983 TaxID=3365106 RepID=UPI00379C6EAB
MTEPTDDPTVLVVGGGPAGSLTAALLAGSGVDVLLLEKEVFPRYHIGEALASSCRPVLELAGAAEKVDAAGFLRKHGGLFRWGAEQDWIADWSALFGPEVRSWSVERGEFDHLLLNNAAERGARVVQGATVKRVVFEGDRPVAAEWTTAEEPGRVRTSRFTHLVDASGRAGLLTAQTLKNRTRHEVFRNVAIWGYWDGDTLLPQTPRGGSNIISAPDGWYWVIPVREGRRSVGFVMHETAFRERRKSGGSLDDLLGELVQESETVRTLLDGDRQIASARVEQDYSYTARSFCGPGYFVAGDAACFLDPLLSTGVHVASYSALLAAASIVAVADGTVDESEALAFYESLFRNAYTRLFAMVGRMYHQYQGKANYFWLAQRLTGAPETSERSDAAFVEVVGGLSDLYDAEHGRAVDRGAPAPAEAAADTGPDDTALGLVDIAPKDLYDTASRLRLVTSPRLGLRRAEAPAEGRAGIAAPRSAEAAQAVEPSV